MTTTLSIDADTPAYRYWRRRILVTTIVGYALYYFVRKNLSVAMPLMESELGIGKSDLGLFLTLHGLLYGVSKFVNGVIGDRVNARRFMASGLAICALVNIAFKFSSSVVGLIGLFGYLSTVLSGVGIGWLVEQYGWDTGFALFFICGVIGALLFALC